MELNEAQVLLERNKEKTAAVIRENLEIRKELAGKQHIHLLDFGFSSLPDLNFVRDPLTLMYFAGKRDQLVNDENLYLKNVMAENNVSLEQMRDGSMTFQREMTSGELADIVNRYM